MATKTWVGGAFAQKQITNVVPGGTIQATDVFIIQIGSKQLTFVATTTTATHVVTGLYNAYTAAIELGGCPEWAELTASNGTTLLQFVANEAGVPFTIQASTVDGGGANTQTLVATQAQLATGPNHWDNALNWFPSTAPTTGDAIVINGSTPILYGMPTSALTITTLDIPASFTGQVGLPDTHGSGQNTYPEYRQKRLIVAPIGAVNIGSGPGNASTLVRLDSQNTAAGTISIARTGNPRDTNIGAVEIVTGSVANAIEVLGGSVTIGSRDGSTLANTATISTVKLGVGTLVLKSGTSVTGAITVSSGTLTTDCAVAAVTQYEGTWNHLSGTANTLLVNGGTANYSSTGAIGTCTVGASGTLDVSGDLSTKTFGIITGFQGGEVRDPNGVITDPIFIGVGTHIGKDGFQVTLPPGRKYTVTVA